jgi:2-oxoglutarate ferredoxin oxidoreductase subunit gamma
MRIEIRISGFGGQGVGLAGHIIGKAIAIYTEKEAVMTQAYGPEARGGASSSNIVISDSKIDYPFVQKPDILIALSQEAYVKFRPGVEENGKVLIDSGLVKPFKNDETLNIPATLLAENLGNRIVANMVMLGYLTKKSRYLDKKPMVKSIETSVKTKFIELNMKAFETGHEYVEGKIFFDFSNYSVNSPPTMRGTADE